MDHDDVDHGPDAGLDHAQQVDPRRCAAVAEDGYAVVRVLAERDPLRLLEDPACTRLVRADERPEGGRRREHRRAEARALDGERVAATRARVRRTEPFAEGAL